MRELGATNREGRFFSRLFSAPFSFLACSLPELSSHEPWFVFSNVPIFIVDIHVDSAGRHIFFPVSHTPGFRRCMFVFGDRSELA